MIIYRKVIVKCIHKQNMGYERFFKSHFEDFPGTNLILFCWIRIVFAWIRIRNEFFTSWIRIRINMIWIRHTAPLDNNYVSTYKKDGR